MYFIIYFHEAYVCQFKLIIESNLQSTFIYYNIDKKDLNSKKIQAHWLVSSAISK